MRMIDLKQSIITHTFGLSRSVLKYILRCIVMAQLLAAPVFADGVLKLATPPSIWVQQQDGKLTGPIINLLVGLFAELNVAVQTEPLPWARAVSHLKSGELDIIPVIFRTRQRARYMAFTIPYIEVPTAVFVPLKKSFPFETLDDLRDKKGLMMRGDSISPAFEAFESELDITRLATYEQLIRMLADQRADYGVAAQYGFLIEAKKLGYDQQIEVLPVPISLRSLHIAFSKKSEFLKYLPTVNKRLRKMQLDGTLQKIVQETISIAAGG